MDTDSLHFPGRLGKPWGHQGELTVHLEEVDLDELVHAGSLFVDIEGQRVPFFFSKLYEKGRDTLIKFDDFHDPQSASVLVGRDTRLLVQGISGQAASEHTRRMLAYGTRVVAGAPWRLQSTAAGVPGPAPLLGQDDTYVCADLLGLPATEVNRLREDRVVY